MAKSRVIRVDEEVWALINRETREVTDTPNKVLRRLLGLGPADRAAVQRARVQARRRNGATKGAH